MSTFIDKKTGLKLTDDSFVPGSGSDVISLMITIDDEIISDTDKLAYSFPLDEKREMKFGIVKINTHVSPKLHKTLFFLFTVDCSGSMYRFNSTDMRLQRSMDAVVMLLESLHGRDQVRSTIFCAPH